MLSEEEENEYISTIRKMEDIEVFFDSERMKGVTISYENWAIFLSYVSAERLVKHSKALTRLTIALYIMTAALVILGIQEAIRLW